MASQRISEGKMFKASGIASEKNLESEEYLACSRNRVVRSQ